MANQHRKYDIDTVRDMFVKEGYTLTTDIYLRATQRLHFICPKGHEYFIQLCSWNAGRRCAMCAGRRLTHDFVKNYIFNTGNELLSVYNRSWDKIKIMCPNKHIYEMTWDNFKQGHRCSRCNGQTSKGEMFLLNDIRNKYLGLDVLHKDRVALAPYEIDIYIPSLVFGVEYNGAGHYLPIYGNTDEDRKINLEKTKERDRNKLLLAKDKGHLIYIVEDTGSFNENRLCSALKHIYHTIDIVRTQDYYRRNPFGHIDDIS